WNTTAVANSSGSIQERYLEDPYGAVSFLAPDWQSRSSTALAWIILHQGGRYQSTTGQYDFRRRFTSPSLGHWLTPDPSHFQRANSNLYLYEANRPSTNLDPSGLRTYVMVYSRGNDDLDQDFYETAKITLTLTVDTSACRYKPIWGIPPSRDDPGLAAPCEC